MRSDAATAAAMLGLLISTLPLAVVAKGVTVFTAVASLRLPK